MAALPLPLVDHLTIESQQIAPQDRLIVAQFGNGYRQVAKDGFNSKIERWNMVYVPLDGISLTTLDTFFNTVGCDAWFTWTPFGESTSKKWRIDAGTLVRKRLEKNSSLFQYSFTMTQDFNLGT